MVYGIYREEEVCMHSRADIVVGDDGEKKRIVHHRHFMKYDYIPMKQIACIESGDGFLRIELKDGNVKYDWQYANFGNVPTTRSELEESYNELPLEPSRFGYFVIDEFVYVDDRTAERMKFNDRTSYMNGEYPNTIVEFINQVQAIYGGCMMTKDVAYGIQNYIFQKLCNATYGEYALDDGVQVTFDADNGVANCVISDEAFKILADYNLL